MNKQVLFIAFLLVVSLALAGCNRQNRNSAQTTGDAPTAVEVAAGTNTGSGLSDVETEVVSELPTEPVTDDTADEELLEILSDIDTELAKGIPSESDLDGIE